MTQHVNTRSITLEEAKEAANAVAMAEIRKAKTLAARDATIAAAKAKADADTKADQEIVDRERAKVVLFVLANRDQFKDKHGRNTSVHTALAKFGLRHVSNLEVTDEKALVQAVLGNGYGECVRTVHKLLLEAIRVRLEAGEQLPGCRIDASDEPFVAALPTLLSEAKKSANPGLVLPAAAA